MSIKKIFNKIKRQTDNDHPVSQHVLDQEIVFRLSKGRLPGRRQWHYLPKFLSKKEKILIIICLFIILASLGLLSYNYYQKHCEKIPQSGGYYVEGLIGTPRYINPLYSSFNQTDRDLARLIYSSLFTRDAQGHLINDLAESYEVSPDHLTYIIKIKDNVKWSNGQNLTAEDVLFTYTAIMDQAYGSPLRNSFSGLEINKVDDLTIKFTLSQPYNAFLDLLTIGIMPRELWGQIPASSASLADLNLKPIGSGPYQFKSLTKDKAGNIKSYELTVNPYYFRQLPYIPKLTFKFYNNYEELAAALGDGSIDGAAYLPQKTAEDLITTRRYDLKYLGTSQLVAIFINSEDKVLKDKNIRRALALSIDKNKILLDNNNLIGHLATGPILNHNPYYDKTIAEVSYNPTEAQKILTDNGWSLKTITPEDVSAAQQKLQDNQGDQNEAKTIIDLGPGQWLQKNNQYLTFNLTVVNEPDYLAIAQQIGLAWQKIGIKTYLDVVDPENINNQIIRRKNYSLLLYGQNLGSENDLTTFWHSTQSGPNGLNLSNYRNEQVDKSLEILRTSADEEAKKKAAQTLQQQITNDLAAIFLYNPTYLYIQNKKIKGFAMEVIIEPADRFNQINEWYIKTKIKWQKSH
ncbi:MAG TPA: ABC transporter substrate-binding protein [bacterium]|nr:ABC transporter substrate-binding protein [bacterium]